MMLARLRRGARPLPTLSLRPRLASTFPTDAIPPAFKASSASSTARKPTSGDEGRSQGFLYFDSVFPIKLGKWDPRFLFAQMEKETLLARVRSLVPADSSLDVRVEDVWPREKDGGAFVAFSFVPPAGPFEAEDGGVKTPEERKAIETKIKATVEKETRDAMAARGSKPWWIFGESRAFLVKGKPWMEDMDRFSNNSIRVEFEGPEIPQEELYDVFRPYGKISNIYPQPPSNKDLPRFATIVYPSLRSAAAARNCLHNALISSSLPIPSPPPPTVLRILYTDRERAHHFRDWITNHPRIVIPIIFALLGGLSWAVFDPIRGWFVQQHVEGTWDTNQWKALAWLKKETLGRLGLANAANASPSTGIERERYEAKALLETWLRDTPDTFIVVTGPRGSGKTALVDDVLSESQNVLTIDCTAICKNARTDTKLVSELASAVGYWPQFVLAASLNNLIDLASVGLIGQKAGFGATLDAQLKQILEVTSVALKHIASDFNNRTARAAKRAATKNTAEQLKVDGARDGRVDAVAGTGVMSELGAGVEKPADKGTSLPLSASEVKSVARADAPNPNEKIGRLPIVVIKGFAAKGEAKQEVLWDVLAEWAAVLVENQVAHVVFTSDVVTLAKPLAKALPNKPFNTISLNDASPESAIQYVESKLAEAGGNVTLSAESRPHVLKLGGRQTDLELLVNKIRAGLAPEEAVEDIVSRNATELRKLFFGDDDEEAKGLPWTRAQAWALMKGLSTSGELRYADVLVNPPFKSDEKALRSLETSELISRPSLIRPGKPVYRSAFELLISDRVFSASLEFKINAASTKSWTAELDAAAKSLIELSQMFGNGRWAFGGSSTVPKEIDVRVTGLLGKMREAEGKLATLEVQRVELLKVLAEAV